MAILKLSSPLSGTPSVSRMNVSLIIVDVLRSYAIRGLQIESSFPTKSTDPPNLRFGTTGPYIAYKTA